jgi:hypothetical protein
MFGTSFAGMEPDNTSNKRLHISFNHSGLICLMPSYTLVYKTILDSMWKSLDLKVSDVFYHAQYSYCFLSFESHEAAQRGMTLLNDEAVIQAKISGFMTACSNPQTNLRVSQLFVKGRNGHMLHASWAAPRTPRHDYQSYHDDYDDYNYRDFIPDGFDSDEWNNYCDD